MFRASQPVTISEERRATPLADETAALDIGANSLVACTTTIGEQYLYEGRGLFERFRKTAREIARLQSKLPEEQDSSKRIRRLYQAGKATTSGLDPEAEADNTQKNH